MNGRGKLFALSTAALALAVTLTAAIMGRRWIVEEYHIRRLASSDEESRLSSAKALGMMKSVRAVPSLLRLIEDENAETEEVAALLTPLVFALIEIGPAALPILRDAVGSTKRDLLISLIQGSTEDEAVRAFE